MSRIYIIDSRSLVKKETSATGSSSHQIEDCVANRECPNCHYLIDNSHVFHKLSDLPSGFKFDPSDSQLLDHLAEKCGLVDSQPHMLLNEFIPTLEEDQGINYTHPENLPGAKKDGSSVHFFHRTVNAYASGQRKRRKIDCQEEHVRWHKTGKTKALIVDGVHKGWKKIMVLYSASKNSKIIKSNWVMHQYHLGAAEEENEGDYVVSKILYQTKQSDKIDDTPITEDPVTSTLDPVTSILRPSPKTPKTNPPNPPRSGESVMCENTANDYISMTALEPEVIAEASSDPQPALQPEDDIGCSAWLAGLNQIPCTGFPHNTNEVTNSSASHRVFELENLEHGSASHVVSELENLKHGSACHGVFEPENQEHCSASRGVSELQNLELDTQPEIQLSDLPSVSQDSLFDLVDQASQGGQ